MFFSFLKSKDKNFKAMKSELSRRFPISGKDIHTGCHAGRISVVLPVYNGEKYLERAISSVLSQTYTDLELIIVNDGSTDKSGEIADSFLSKDNRVKVLHQKNLKLPTALNNGFAAASGEFFTWTSADNIMLPECLEILAAELMRDRNCDMVYGNMRLIAENDNILRGFGWYELPPMSGNVILPDSAEKLNVIANNTIGAAFLYRSGSASLLCGYSVYKYTLEDYDYFMRMNSLMTVKHIIRKKPIYEYRIHSESLTAHDSELKITSSRPQLMELDRKRRQFYLKNIAFYADGNGDELLSAISHTGKRICSQKTANELAARSPQEIFYLNFGNVTPTWTPPEGIPKFLISQFPCAGAFGYDVMLCKSLSAVKESSDWIAVSDTAAAPFIALRARNNLLYHYESKICTE